MSVYSKRSKKKRERVPIAQGCMPCAIMFAWPTGSYARLQHHSKQVCFNFPPPVACCSSHAHKTIKGKQLYKNKGSLGWSADEERGQPQELIQITRLGKI